MSFRVRIESVFDQARFHAPRTERFHLPAEALRALVHAFVAAGYHEMMPYDRAFPGVTLERPNIHYDGLAGPACFAEWVRLREKSGAWVFLPISYVAPLFTATHTLYPDPPDARTVPDVREWSRTPEIAVIVQRAGAALKAFGFEYVEWNSGALDEPTPMRDMPAALARDLLFSYQPYE